MKKQHAARFGIYLVGMVLLALGILLTGIGAAMTVDMQLIPNPGDGIVSSLADRFGPGAGAVQKLF